MSEWLLHEWSSACSKPCKTKEQCSSVTHNYAESYWLTADGGRIYPVWDKAAACRRFAQAWDVATPYSLLFPLQRLFHSCSAKRHRFMASDIANSEGLDRPAASLTTWRLWQPRLTKGLQVLPVSSMKMAASWDAAPCSLVEV
jgi:hypothetical protein